MKELKFRAWDIDCHRFEYFEIGENNDCYGMFRVAANKFGSVIEQYTGLKDENGREIYEGDIVTLNGEWEEIEHGDCSIVTFENGCFRVGNGYENEAGSYLSDWRIIGNIHENPELLEEEECGN